MEHAMLWWGWWQGEWMEIRLVRQTGPRSQEASYPFFTCYTVPQCGWGNSEGEPGIWVAFSMCLFPFLHATLTLLWKFTFLLSTTFQFYHSPAYPTFTPSWLALPDWTISYNYSPDITIYNLLPGLPTSTLVSGGLLPQGRQCALLKIKMRSHQFLA